MTEKVRIKSIAETCRVAVVEAREQVDRPDDEDDLSDDDDDMDDVFSTDDYTAPGRWEMETARVYEKTIQLLGDELGKAGEFCDTNLAPGDACQAEPSEEKGTSRVWGFLAKGVEGLLRSAKKYSGI
ncbi:unnamed protein product [Aspergillus oryzae RIB40]|uniref:DNA, SC038 n=2 Tax=Aspergillus oryzae TaxID=5062 RepID=Q2U251_ASPOR|nr:unnamed protein product [Aspergillus oryzae RIB40]EIT77330.1 hypothetical protein Ao3042_06451 [Aspergillus oryzae 3.042]KDE82390.1 hypothetical protein AO1008_08798 [Aspergillus oryzae 100-8]BAE64364.1 unnamed protein product [Aspergillus oryzae RIB40]|eukprot:EIT77330.1 hypothetical protein Ao3042_06451 [Aspergillus oryzae 3.042]